MIQIVQASRSDVPGMLEISNEAAERTVANFATQPEDLAVWMKAWEDTHETHPWLAAKRAEEVLGFARASPHKVRGAYAWTVEVSVYVRPQAHRQGVGRRLYARLVALLRAQGYATAIAGITLPNPASERLHESFGFTRCATFHRVGWKFGRWHDVGYWELRLQDGDGPPAEIRDVEGGLALTNEPLGEFP